MLPGIAALAILQCGSGSVPGPFYIFMDINRESDRLRKLYQMEVLDTPSERNFDEIVQLASQLTKTPISLITLLDTDRQWFKAKVGLDVDSSDRPSAVCNYTIQGDSLFEVEDLRADKRFESNAMVKGGPKLRYYAGMPLITSDGYKLGALCVLDIKTHTPLSAEQSFALEVLARQAMAQIELRVRNRELAATKAITDRIARMVGEEFAEGPQLLRRLLKGFEGGDLSCADLAGAVQDLKQHLELGDDAYSKLLDWSRLQMALSGEGQRECRLKDLLGACVGELEPVVKTKRNAILTELGSGSDTVPVAPAALRFILRILLHNANKYTRDGRITVRYFTTPGSLKASPRQYISVSDTGMGIPADWLDGYKNGEGLPVRDGTEGEKGHGQSLLLVQQVLFQIGAKLHIESVSNEHFTAIVII